MTNKVDSIQNTVDIESYPAFLGVEDQLRDQIDAKVAQVAQGKTPEKGEPTRKKSLVEKTITVEKEESEGILSMIIRVLIETFSACFSSNPEEPRNEVIVTQKTVSTSAKKAHVLSKDEERRKEIMEICKEKISKHDRHLTAQVAVRAMHPGLDCIESLEDLFEIAFRSSSGVGTDPLNPEQERYAEIIELTINNDTLDIAILALKLGKTHNQKKPAEIVEMATLQYNRTQTATS